MTFRNLPAPQRVGPFVRMPERMAESGIDPEPVFRDLFFDPGAFAEADARPPFRGALLTLDRAAHLAGRVDFGILLDLRNDHRRLGAVGELMTRDDIGEALADAVAAQMGNSTGASACLIPGATGSPSAPASGIPRSSAPDRPTPSPWGDGKQGPGALRRRGLVRRSAFRLPRPGRGRRLRPALRGPGALQRDADLPAAAPGVAHGAEPRRRPERRARILAAITDRRRLDQRTVTERLRHALRAAPCLDLPSGAARLQLSTRSLDRRLTEEGASFRPQLDAIRHGVARELSARSGRLPPPRRTAGPRRARGRPSPRKVGPARRRRAGQAAGASRWMPYRSMAAPSLAKSGRSCRSSVPTSRKKAIMADSSRTTIFAGSPLSFA